MILPMGSGLGIGFDLLEKFLILKIKAQFRAHTEA